MYVLLFLCMLALGPHLEYKFLEFRDHWCLHFLDIATETGKMGFITITS